MITIKKASGDPNQGVCTTGHRSALRYHCTKTAKSKLLVLIKPYLVVLFMTVGTCIITGDKIIIALLPIVIKCVMNYSICFKVFCRTVFMTVLCWVSSRPYFQFRA